MSIAKTPREVEEIVNKWRNEGLKVGFVPTMGALHDGHLSLVKVALEKADRLVVSVFVNPTQFAPNEDFDTYPRQTELDAQTLQDAGTHLVYTPTETEIYPDGARITVKAGNAAKGLESDFRPHFFDGVTTVVHTLFSHVKPDLAVFGEKDYQQLQVIKEMVETHSMGIEIIGAPIIRDKKGLALSSRNAYLSSEQLITARMLNQVLLSIAEVIQDYPEEADKLIPECMQALYEVGFDNIDYIDIRWNRVLAAAWIGKTRLIDNVAI